MVKVKVINGFTDIKTGKNYQDNEIIELSEGRAEELNGSYIEPCSLPVESKPKLNKDGVPNGKIQK